MTEQHVEVLVRTVSLSSEQCIRFVIRSVMTNDLAIGWQNLNSLSHPNATLAPQARQAGPVVKY